MDEVAPGQKVRPPEFPDKKSLLVANSVLRRKAKEAARTRDRQAAASQDEAEENDATEEEMTRERTTRVGRPRGGMKAAARSGERLRREIGRGRLPRVGDG